MKTITPIPLQISQGECVAWFDFADTSSANMSQSAGKVSSVLNKVGNYKPVRYRGHSPNNKPIFL